MEQNFAYINENYITEDDLCTVTDISKDDLAELIQNELVPQASYTVSRSIRITSPLNDGFESEWAAYCNGIYGICTLHSTEEEIVKKEIAVKKLIHFNAQLSGKKLTDDESEELIKLSEEFNEVAQKFAPYQRKSSSRGKYLDTILEENNLDYLVKKY